MYENRPRDTQSICGLLSGEEMVSFYAYSEKYSTMFSIG